MDTDNQISEQQFKKMQDEIKEMHAKYNTLSNDVKNLKDSQAGIQENMNAISGNFERMNGSMEEIINKLNGISEDQKKSTMDRLMGEKGGFYSRTVRKPLRKLAVGTVSAFMTLGDFAMEKASGAKESMEDIVAEASYNNKTKRNKAFESSPSEG